jgi:hypothetical protein
MQRPASLTEVLTACCSELNKEMPACRTEREYSRSARETDKLGIKKLDHNRIT